MDQPDPLIEAVEALTRIRHVMIDTDDGPRWATGAPRLEMLQDAIYSSMGGSTGGATLASERMMLSPDALYRAAIITSQVGDWCRMAGVRVTRNPVTDLDAWYEARAADDDRADDWHIAQLEEWARSIDRMFNRPRVRDVQAPCPVCRATSYVNDDGDVCAWPLKATAQPFRVQCLACGDLAWEGIEAVGELAEEIGANTPENIAEIIRNVA